MTTEDRLHHASAEIERVTGSLTPPPVGKLRRSARLRSVGAAVGAALGAVALVGGVVLALDAGGETTLAPASPTETTAPIVVDGIRVVIPEPDPDPEFDLGAESHEVAYQGLGEGFADDIRTAGKDLSAQWLERIDEIVFVGASGEYRAYALIGIFGGNAPPGYAGRVAMCTVAFTIDSITGGCGDPSGSESLLSAVETHRYASTVTYIVYGRAPQGSSVVAVEVDGVRLWRQTRDGYLHLAVDGSVASQVRFIIYDVAGNVLVESAMSGGGLRSDGRPAVTSAPAVEDDGSCSGHREYSDGVLRAELPDPVVQTLGRILLFSNRCWFNELAGVATDNFTASFGGGDPAQLWASQEENGDEPMYALMRILAMPFGTIELEDGLMYGWPAAAAHDGDWDAVPEADKEALRTLYNDDDFVVFSDFGYYVGYRLGITENGDWSFFVAGD